MVETIFFSIFIILIDFDFVNSTTSSHGNGRYSQFKMFPGVHFKGPKVLT